MTPTSQMGTLTMAQMIKQQTTRNDGPHLSPRAPVSFSVADAWTRACFLCCGTRKETYCREEGESLQHLPGNNDYKLPLVVFQAV